MSTDLIFQDQTISDKGHQYWFYQRESEIAAGTWHQGVGKVKTDVDVGQESKPIIWESGGQGPSIADAVKSEFVIESPDDTVELEKFLLEETKNARFNVVLFSGIVNDPNSSGVLQKVRFLPLCTISRHYKTTKPGMAVQVKFNPQANASNITLSGLTAINTFTSGGFQCPTLPATFVVSASDIGYSLSGYVVTA